MASTMVEAVADFLGGLVAAEGTFSIGRVRRRDGRTRPSFALVVALGAVDASSTELLREFLGVGRLRSYPRRQEHHDDVTVFAVRSFGDLVDVVVPFLDEHLPASHKRVQYLAWRAELLAYEVRRHQRTPP